MAHRSSPAAVDYVAWTERVAGFAGRPDLQGTSGSLWITGRMSPEAQRQFAALGWTIHQNVLPPGNASAATPSIVGVWTLTMRATLRGA